MSGTTKEGTTLLGMHQCAQQLGFQAEGLKADSIENFKNELKDPVILHTRIPTEVAGRWLHHYLICYGWDSKQGKFLLGDPNKGLYNCLPEDLAFIWESRILLVLTPDSAFEVGYITKRKQWQWLVIVIQDDIPRLIVATVLGLVAAILSLSTALFSQKLVDVILPQRDVKRLWLGLALLVFLLLARAIISYLRGHLLSKQSSDFNNRLINNFFKLLLYLPKSFFDHRRTGDLVTRLNDTSRIQLAISSIAGNVVINTFVMLSSFVAIYVYSKYILLTTFIILPIYAIIIWRFHKSIIEGQRLVMAASSHNESQYVNTIQGIDTIKASGKEQFFLDITRHTYSEFQRQALQLRSIGLNFNLLTEGIGAVILVIILASASYLVINSQLKLGAMMAIISLAASIIPSISNLALANIQIQEARVAFDRMYEYTSLTAEKGVELAPQLLSISTIEIISLSFRFPGRKLSLNQINLRLNSGELVTIMGDSGGGKSTFLNLLQRLYYPTSGTILLDGQDWGNVSTSTWRQFLGVMPQQQKLFNGTLLENICLSSSVLEIDASIKFCQKWGFEKYFLAFPQGYNTRIGEEGISLSGGQQQLLALARAIYRNPSMLLLDEPTASMDDDTELFVLNLLERLKIDKIILCVTHRKSLLSLSDRAYNLVAGELHPLVLTEN